MLKNLQKRSQGFTIVEVMIVLAIAGLIILVVLLAVPALQRNSRNTTMKNDVSAITGALNEYSSTNNGRAPGGAANNDGRLQVTGTGEAVEGKVQGSLEVNWGSEDMPTEPGIVNIAPERKCNPEQTDLDPTPSRRSVALLYVLETSSGVADQCADA